ncbi:hypothetical protein Tco_0159128 [Tanacetum coccineum]
MKFILNLVVEINKEGEVVCKFLSLRVKIVEPLTSLTERNQKYEWSVEQEEAFQTLKNDLCDTPIKRMSVMDEAYASSLRYLSENEIKSPWILSLNFQGQSNNSKEWNFGDDQLRLRWMIYLVVLANIAESVRDAIGFEVALNPQMGDGHKVERMISGLWKILMIGNVSPVLWAEFGESSLSGLELVQETTDKVVLVKEKSKAEGVVHFGKKGKLAPRYIGPFEILKRIGLAAYRLRLPEELNSDMPRVDKTLHFVKKAVEIMD